MKDKTVDEILGTLYGNIDNGNLPVEAYLAQAKLSLLQAIKGVKPNIKPYGKDTPDEYTENYNNGYNKGVADYKANIIKLFKENK